MSHTSTSHVPHTWFMAYIHESRHTCQNTVETERDIVVTSHVTHINESRSIYTWVVSCKWVISQPPKCQWDWGRYRSSQSCHKCKWVMSHTSMSHITPARSSQSCHKCKWVMSHMFLSHVTHLPRHRWDGGRHRSGESCHTYKRVTSHIFMSHVTHLPKCRWDWGWCHSGLARVCYTQRSPSTTPMARSLL